LGKRLLLKVEAMMITGNEVPIVQEGVSLSDAIVEISSKRLGATCIIDDTGVLKGILTDGDLRRLLQRTTNISNLTARQVMTQNPKTIRQNILAAQALKVMETFKITQLVVVDGNQHPVGFLHLHDLVEAGLGGDPST
jgi:arabinose-5-phosphate isomerase